MITPGLKQAVGQVYAVKQRVLDHLPEVIRSTQAGLLQEYFARLKERNEEHRQRLLMTGGWLATEPPVLVHARIRWALAECEEMLSFALPPSPVVDARLLWMFEEIFPTEINLSCEALFMARYFEENDIASALNTVLADARDAERSIKDLILSFPHGSDPVRSLPVPGSAVTVS